MKQKLLNSIRLRALMLVAVLCAAFAGQAWADTVTLTSAQIKAGSGSTSYGACSATDGDDNTWNAYAIKNQHSNATSDYNFWQIKKYASKTAYYIQVPVLGTRITQLQITVSGSSQAMASGGNSATLYFSASNSTSATGTGVVSGTGTSSVTLDCSSLNLNTGYITASGAVRIWQIVATYETSSASYCATPTFSVAAGTYTTTKSVTISTETDGASIYYTTDGSTPTDESTLYDGAISVSETMTINAIAVKDGLDNSSVASAAYTIIQHAGTSVDPYTVVDAKAAIDASIGVTGVYVTGIVCEGGSSLTDGAMNYWISDDGTESNKFEIYRGKGISGADFEATSDIQVGDIVVVTGNLTKYSTTYEFSAGSQLVSLVRKPAVPTFSPAAGLVVSGTQVALACLTDGATIYYTTNGSTPTTTSSVYSSAITVTENMTIKAIAVKNEVSSDVAEAAYTIALPVATPTFSPAAGTYSSVQSVTISTETADATIYYSYDNESWTAYTAALNIDETKTVYAKAQKDGMAPSAVASAEFTIHIPSITFSEATPKNLTYDAQTYDVAFTSEYTSGTLAAVLCDSEGNTTTYDWFSAAIVGDAVRVTLTKNEDTVNGRTAYFKVTADNATSAVFSVVQAKFVADYATLPFAWAGGTKSALDDVTGVSIDGLGSDYADSNAPYRVKMDGVGDYILIKTDGQPGVVSVGVKMIGGATTSKIKVQQSADGTNFTDVEELTISGSQNDVVNLATNNAFNSASRYVKIIKSVHATGGNIGVGPISITKASTEPAIVAESSVDLDDTDTSGEITYSINNPNGSSLTAATTTDWISNVTVDSENSKVTFTTTANTGAERVGTITLSYTGAVDKVITVTQAEYVVELTYNLVTSITSGKHYVIVNNDDDKAMGGQNTNNRAAVGVTSGAENITFLSNAGVTEFIIYGPDADDLYTIYDEKNEGYLYAASGSSNHLKTQANIDNNARWKITFNAEDVASIVAEKSSNNKVMQYNSGSTIFSCYGSASQSPVYLYEKDGEATPTESVTVGPAGYTTYTTVNPVSFPTGVTAYIATAVNPSTIHLEEVLDAPARTPLVIKAEAGTYELEREYAELYNDIVAATPNILKSSDGSITGNGTSIYALGVGKAAPYVGVVGFYLVNDGQTIPAGKAYLNTAGGGAVKEFLTFDFDDATAIAKIQDSGSKIQDSEIFNLAGQKMSKLQKGVNIVGGKKVLVK